MTTLLVFRGLAKDFRRRRTRSVDGLTYDPTTTPFRDSDVLACRVAATQGGDPVITTAPPAWEDATNGTFLISFEAADTAELAPGRYYYEVTATRDGRTGPVDYGYLQILAWVGTGPDPPAAVMPAAAPGRADVLAAGTAWLTTQLRTFASQPAVYARDGDYAAVRATAGKKLLRIDDGGGGTFVEWTDMDFLIPAADLVINAAPVTPRRGDRVYLTVGDRLQAYEVAPYGSEPAWRWSDPMQTLARVHTKLIEETAVA